MSVNVSERKTQWKGESGWNESRERIARGRKESLIQES